MSTVFEKIGMTIGGLILAFGPPVYMVVSNGNYRQEKRAFLERLESDAIPELGSYRLAGTNAFYADTNDNGRLESVFVEPVTGVMYKITQGENGVNIQNLNCEVR